MTGTGPPSVDREPSGTEGHDLMTRREVARKFGVFSRTVVGWARRNPWVLTEVPMPRTGPGTSGQRSGSCTNAGFEGHGIRVVAETGARELNQLPLPCQRSTGYDGAYFLTCLTLATRGTAQDHDSEADAEVVGVRYRASSR